MNYLLDTNVISEWVKPRPSASVDAWLRTVPPEQLFASAVSFAEIARGIAKLPPGRRRTDLLAWFEDDLRVYFAENIVAIDIEVATYCGRISAVTELAGRRMSPMDAFIAATAEVHGFTLVTRNVRDFEAWGGPIFDPWTA